MITKTLKADSKTIMTDNKINKRKDKIIDDDELVNIVERNYKSRELLIDIQSKKFLKKHKVSFSQFDLCVPFYGQET